MSEQPSSAAPRTPTQPAGDMLRQARERKGLGIEQAAAQLNLRPSLISDLESERYDQLQVPAYRRGYLRAYARLVGIDAAEVLRAHDAIHGKSDTHDALRATPIQAVRRPSRLGKLVFRLVTVIILLVLLGLTALWWQSRDGLPNFAENTPGSDVSSEALEEEPSTPPSAPVAPAASLSGEVIDLDAALAVAGAEASEAIGGNGLQIDVGEGVNGAQLTASEAAALSNQSRSAPSQDEQASAAASGEDVLSLSFREASWVEVRDANNMVVLTGLQPAGSERSVEGAPPLRLVIGNASGVSLSFRGQPVDLPARTGGSNVARFTLGE
ncbi:RodZ domain-containing protein [Halotalea alkalilenta]|uniref:RodZ domain-containing protein n=1 Tax=Halotalea alkalilenta TaxID=376489 RepID=UPI000488AEAD|nr:RodZ domain-containing protein [Halotalea alkalilenta]